MGELITTEVAKSEEGQAFHALITSGKAFSTELAALEDAAEVQFHKALALITFRRQFPDAAMEVLMQLAGTSIGFKTDKDKNGPEGGTNYPVAIVKDSVIQAMIHGARLLGNEFNIIAGGCYLCLPYFERSLKEMPGVKDVIIDAYDPVEVRLRGKQFEMRVSAHASAVVDGKLIEVFARKDEDHDGRFLVDSFEGKADQAIGKAKRRIAKKLYERISGICIEDEDVDDDAPSVTVVEQSSPAIEQKPEATEASVDPPANENQIDWAAEFTKFDIIEQARMIQGANSAEDRASVLEIVKDQVKEGQIDSRGLAMLEKYAMHKNAEQLQEA